jgi:hypothetical protein
MKEQIVEEIISEEVIKIHGSEINKLGELLETILAGGAVVTIQQDKNDYVVSADDQDTGIGFKVSCDHWVYGLLATAKGFVKYLKEDKAQ